MFFCKNCSKLLDEDLKVCPYCGAADDELNLTEQKTPELIEPEPEKQEFTAPELETPPLISGADTLDDTILKINDMIEKNQQADINTAPLDIIDKPEQPQIISSTDATDSLSSQPGTSSSPTEEDVSQGIKAGLIIMSIFVPIAGIIFGAIYMSKPFLKQKSFGKLILIISIVLTSLYFICCCSMIFLSLAQGNLYY